VLTPDNINHQLQLRLMSRFSTAFTFIVLLWSGGVLFGQKNSPSRQDTQPFLKKCSKTIPPPCADKAPVLTYAPDPGYPKEAEKAQVAGTVVLEVVVGTDGRAHEIHVVTSVGYGLDEEAVRTVRQWKFKPGKSAGRPAPVQVTVQVSFRYSPR